jgi:hypothetical protein
MLGIPYHTWLNSLLQGQIIDLPSLIARLAHFGIQNESRLLRYPLKLGI